MPFQPKLDLLTQDQRKQIFKEALDRGAFVTAENWYKTAGLSKMALYQRLNRYVKTMSSESAALVTPGRIPGKNKNGKGKAPEKELSTEEKDLLDRLGKGTVGLEEMGNIVAVRVFEKILKNPDDFRFIDFFRMQLVKIKEQETKSKEKWGNELLARMFAGKLPPSKCPECGFNFMETTVLKGEVIDESIPLTESI